MLIHLQPTTEERQSYVAYRIGKAHVLTNVLAAWYQIHHDLEARKPKNTNSRYPTWIKERRERMAKDNWHKVASKRAIIGQIGIGSKKINIWEL